MKWNAWGDPQEAKPLSEGIRSLLNQALGVTESPTAELDPDQVTLRPSQLADTHREALTAIVGPDYCRVSHRDRLLHAGGKSTLDLLRRKDSGVQEAPDAVLLPGTDDDVAAILRYCSQHGIAVVPFGGGTSVVGGLDPIRGEFSAVVALDLRRFDALLAFDAISGEAEFGAGVTGPQAEQLLARHGFSLGHFPQSFEFASLGGYAATRSSGQDSAGYGRFDDMIRGLHVITPAGALNLGRAPQSAAGPDLRQLLIGSEGVFGIITRVRVRVHPAPEVTRYEAWSFPDFASGTAALRAVTQTGTGPTVIRLSDEAETGVNLATTEAIGETQITGGCLAITVFEGTAAHAESRHTETRRAHHGNGRHVARRSPGTGLGAWPVRRALSARLAAGRRCALRDPGDGHRLVQHSRAEGRRHRRADGRAGRIRHAGAGAVPHFACVCHRCLAVFHRRRRATRKPIEQWRAAKTAAGDAIVATGGTITHHHAVGADHRPWMRDEVGDLGVQVLRAVKATLDPAGILDPGKLIP